MGLQTSILKTNLFESVGHQLLKKICYEKSAPSPGPQECLIIWGASSNVVGIICLPALVGIGLADLPKSRGVGGALTPPVFLWP